MDPSLAHSMWNCLETKRTMMDRRCPRPKNGCEERLLARCVGPRSAGPAAVFDKSEKLADLIGDMFGKPVC